jgi:hypothetical protein
VRYLGIGALADAFAIFQQPHHQFAAIVTKDDGTGSIVGLLS